MDIVTNYADSTWKNLKRNRLYMHTCTCLVCLCRILTAVVNGNFVNTHLPYQHLHFATNSRFFVKQQMTRQGGFFLKYLLFTWLVWKILTLYSAIMFAVIDQPTIQWGNEFGKFKSILCLSCRVGDQVFISRKKKQVIY